MEFKTVGPTEHFPIFYTQPMFTFFHVLISFDLCAKQLCTSLVATGERTTGFSVFGPKRRRVSIRYVPNWHTTAPSLVSTQKPLRLKDTFACKARYMFPLCRVFFEFFLSGESIPTPFRGTSKRIVVSDFEAV